MRRGRLFKTTILALFLVTGLACKHEDKKTVETPVNAFFVELAKQNTQVTAEEIEFIDASFRKNGKFEKSSFGDYSVGLEALNKEAYIKVQPKAGSYFVELNSRSGNWEFSVEVDRATGAWKNPAQFDEASAPESED
ncbi:MAG: hypothetical protein H6624_12600 [Bdellovibrionaceae bacterium]|nr:hypothetical protein [Bdellovibrionales bacterium]MCB9085184.1 hypothetical protein [Pseudobdellovibrionaceae bacterium]